jgi:hypothetical protein
VFRRRVNKKSVEFNHSFYSPVHSLDIFFPHCRFHIRRTLPKGVEKKMKFTMHILIFLSALAIVTAVTKPTEEQKAVDLTGKKQHAPPQIQTEVSFSNCYQSSPENLHSQN